MKIIKFRARNKQSKWYYSELIGLDLFFSTILHEKIEAQQFTGLKDKNGKEIYEGDIIKHIPLSLDWEDADKDCIISSIVEFSEGTFRTNAKQWSDGDHDWNSLENTDMSKAEVIGNIYENPELLK